MSEIFNIYCDESCHLENDGHRVMVLGAVLCPLEKTREICVRIREKKVENGMNARFEAKWTKVSPAKVKLYKDLIDYFFDDDDLHFRGIVIPDKSFLRHDDYNQSHDEWYYKMYFELLKIILSPRHRYRIYIDIKDTRSSQKVKSLQNVLCNNMYDFSREIIERVQQVRSHEAEVMQLTDLIIGALGYSQKGLTGSSAKSSLVSRIKERSRYSLSRTTLLRERKFNLLYWNPSQGQ